MITFSLTNLAATVAFGKKIGQQARPGDVITLSGDLGAGKTTLTQAIGLGLQVPQECYITSPTFSLLHEYPGRIPLYHMDLYRLGGEDEVAELGFEDYIYGTGLTVIEWPNRLGELFPDDYLNIDIKIDDADENCRTIILTPYGGDWQTRIILLVKK